MAWHIGTSFCPALGFLKLGNYVVSIPGLRTRLTLIMTKCGNVQQNRLNYNQLTFCFSEIYLSELSDSTVDMPN